MRGTAGDHGMRQRTVTTCTVFTLLGCLLTGCATVIAGQPTEADTVLRTTPDTSFVHGSDGDPTDQLAAAAVDDIQTFWRQTFPAVFGRPWTNLRGGFYSVDTAAPAAKAPPCADSAAQIQGNAYYCPSGDSVAWDRTALLPVLRERFGDAAVVVVLAHEMGHAVQHRTGLTPAVERADPARYPSILLESMADCYAGTFLRWAAGGHGGYLRIGPRDVDAALAALVTFRDPIGAADADTAHGDAFDRVSAFQDGYQQGPKTCAGMTVANRQFTQETFTGRAAALPGATRNVPTLVGSLAPDLAGYFGGIVTSAGHAWHAPVVRQVGTEPRCPAPAGDQGPIAFCPGTDEIDVDTGSGGPLSRLDTDLGDYATGTILASRYALAALTALGRPSTGTAAARTGLCLTGAYTQSLLQGGRGVTRQGFALAEPPTGDLDDAVQVLLDEDYASRDTAGHPIGTGFDRVAAFRPGVHAGVSACGLR